MHLSFKTPPLLMKPASALASCLHWLASRFAPSRADSRGAPGPYGLLVERRPDRS